MLIPAAAPESAAAASCAANSEAPVIAAPSWGQQRMGAERAWPRSTGKGVIVSVVDTGVSAHAASLRGAVLPGSDLSGGRGDTDCFGRGTFIASLIAGRAVEGTEFVGIAPGATILPIRLTDDPGNFDLDKNLPGPLAAAINASVKAGAQVIAIPLTTSVDDAGVRQAVKAALSKDVLIIASAARPDQGPTFPAQLDGVLSVSPLTPAGGVDPANLGAVPDLAAPSSDLIGAVPDGDGHIGGSDNGVAVSYVAGAAALVIEEYPELTVPQIIERLIHTADGSSAATGAEEGRDPSIGYGVVNPVAAVTRLDTEASATSEPMVTALALPPEPDGRPVNLALVVSLGALAIAVLVIGPTVGTILARRRSTVE